MKRQNMLILSFIGIFFIVGLLTLNGFGLLSVVGVDESLEEQTDWFFQDLQTGTNQHEAILKLPDKTSKFSFTVDYDIETAYRSTADVRADVDYEVFNHVASRWDKVHDKTWNLKNFDRERAEIDQDGQSVYKNGIPEHLESIRISSSPTTYDRYYGCLEGMSVEEAKALNPWTEGDRIYNYKCIYPGNSLSVHSVTDDADEDWDIELFPELITLGEKYIKDNQALFRIKVSISGSGIDSFYDSDFQIDLWEVITDKETYFRFKNNACTEEELFTYQISSSDYSTMKECQSNIILQKYIYDKSLDDCRKVSVGFDDATINHHDTYEECLSGRNIFQKIWNWIKSLFTGSQ